MDYSMEVMLEDERKLLESFKNETDPKIIERILKDNEELIYTLQNAARILDATKGQEVIESLKRVSAAAQNRINELRGN